MNSYLQAAKRKEIQETESKSSTIYNTLEYYRPIRIHTYMRHITTILNDDQIMRRNVKFGNDLKIVNSK